MRSLRWFRRSSALVLLAVLLVVASDPFGASAVDDTQTNKGLPGPPAVLGHPDQDDPNCPSWFLSLRDWGQSLGGSPGDASISFRVYPQSIPIDHVDAGVRWVNWSQVGPDGRYDSDIVMQMTYTPDPDATVRNRAIVNVGPGDVSATIFGTAYMVSGRVCDVPEMLRAWTRVQGGSGSNLGFGDIYPQTADLDNNNQADDTHCGNICNKDQDTTTEAEQNALRIKICYPLDKANDPAFVPCKKSALKAIGAREGRGWKCWEKVNGNGYVGPTAPENAPPNPDGSTYSGIFFGDCGYLVPARPTLQAPRPTPSCTNGLTVSSTTGTITCDSGTGSVHILSDVPWASTTATAQPTTTPVATYPPELYVYPDDGIQPSQIVTVEWSNIPNPTSSDWIVLYKSDGTHQNPTLRIYTDNCNAGSHGSTAVANGSCSVHLPSSQSNFPVGTYHFRLYHNASESDANLVQSSNTFERTP